MIEYMKLASIRVLVCV